MATRVGLAAADVIACAGSMLVVSAISGAALHDLGRGAAPLLRAAREDGRAVRPRPVHPAQDDARRGAGARGGRGDLRAGDRGRPGARSSPAARTRCCCGACWWARSSSAARSLASWRCASTGQRAAAGDRRRRRDGARQAQARRASPGSTPRSSAACRPSGGPRGLRQAARHGRRPARGDRASTASSE